MEGRKREAGEKGSVSFLLLSFLFSLCSSSTYKVISTGYNTRSGAGWGAGGGDR